MKTNIKSMRVCRLIMRISKYRRLAVVAAAAALVAASPPARADEYWLSGSSGATGSRDNPSGALKLVRNDVILLDANKTANPGFVSFTPWVAVEPSTSLASQLMNGSTSPYMGYMSGDQGLYSEFKPYERLNELLAKTPSLASLMPSFFTQSDPVYLAGKIGQDNVDTPDVIKAVTANPFNTWPISIYSSDALDPVTGAPRVDMQNAAWVVLASTGTTLAEKVQLLDYFGEYTAVTGKGRPWDGSYSMITLEHVIFYGGYASSGGAINFRRSDGLTGNANTRAIVQVKGDVAFVGNMANQLGGAIQGQDSIQFDGNVYMVGNMAGVTYDTTEKVIKFSTSGGGSYHGEGGAMRIGSGGQTVTFNQDAIFVGNLAASSGGVMSLHNNSTLQFNGKAVFMGNQAGLFVKPGHGREGGNGGAIVLSSNGNQALFAGESYFIANEASGYGGAISSGLSDVDNNGFFRFAANALFSDNISGFNPVVSTVYSNTTTQKDESGNFKYPATIATGGIDEHGVWSGTTIINVFSGTLKDSGDPGLVYGAKLRGGGAFYGIGTYLLFTEGAEASFLRNSANGVGGAIYVLKNSTASPSGNLSGFGAAFYDNATFVGNTAAINGGAIAAGTYGVKSDVLEYNSGTATSAAVYFGKAGAGSTLTMHGNIAYTAPTVVSTDASASTTGTAFSFTLSTGTTVRASNGTLTADVPVFGGGAVFSIGGLYVESMYSFWHNQTGGSGGALLIGSGTTPSLITTRMGLNYALVLNPLDWKAAGTYSKAGDFALFQDNVALYNGGAIAAHDGASLYIGSGAKFLNNYAGGEGGAISLAMTSGQTYGLLDAPQLDLRARVADIVFQGNRSGVNIDASGVDFAKILDSNVTTESTISADGYMRVDATSGRKNDIYVGLGAAASTSDHVATINMDAYENMKISFDGGIAMDNSGTKNLVININTTLDETGTSIGSATTTNVLLDNITPNGLVVLDNVSADIEGVTTIGNGTLRIQGTSNNLHWGSGTSVTRAGTEFNLNGPATLEANAAINAETITIGDGATLRVLGSAVGSGSLALNAGSGGVNYEGSVNLAGNGRIETGVSALAGIASIIVGDVGHTSGQTLAIARDSSALANVTLSNVKISLGLFDGGSDKIEAGSLVLSGANDISLTSLAQGAFNIATAAGGITSTAVYTIDYKGTVLTGNARMTVGVATAGNNLQLTYTTSNEVLDWSGASSNSWTMSSGNMSGAYADYVLGDVVRFGVVAPASGAVSVDENIGLSGMIVEGDYTFTGDYGITTQASAWGGGAQSLADGRLTMSGVGKTLVLANATGEGQSNEFTGGILIQGGTIAAGTAAQLGAALSQITFDNATGNGAALLVTGTMILDGAASLHSQRLDIADGNTATFATSAAGSLYVINNSAESGDGGVFNIGDGATLNLDAQGGMSFLNNTANRGGALSLGSSATVNINVADGAAVMFGLQGDRAFETAANTSSEDSIHGSIDSVINKDGEGTLSINSYSTGFSGTLNVNKGRLMFGEGTVFGSADSNINVGAGALLGGAATIGGNLTINQGSLAVDAGVAFGRTAWTSAQTLTVNGDLSLSGASLIFNAMINKSTEYSADVINVVGDVLITGTTTLELNRLTNGATTLIYSSGDILMDDTASLVSGGVFATSEFNWSAKDFIITKGGIELDPTRYNTQVEYEFINTVVISTGTIDGVEVTATTTYDGSTAVTSMDIAGTGTTITTSYDYKKGDVIVLPEGYTAVSQTDYYNTGKLQLISGVKNMKAYWAGAAGTMAWNNMLENWNIVNLEGDTISDKTFADGDSVFFAGDTGAAIAVDLSGVWVADMTFSGGGNWTFEGGEINTNAGANNYKDENGVDLSTGQLVLDESFTGTLALLNEHVRFNGIYVDTGSGMSKSSDIEIKNGTLVASSGVLNGNLILNESTLILQQSNNEDFYNTRVYGGGDIIQTGDYKISLKETGIIETANYYLKEGILEIDDIGSMIVTNTFTIDPGATLLLNQGLVAGTLYNSGVLRKSPYNGDAQKPPTDTIMIRDPAVGVSTIFLQGSYYSNGGVLELNTYRDAVMINNLFVTGSAKGAGKVIIRNITSMDSEATVTGSVFGSGTYFQPYGMPHSVNPVAVPKRDTPVVTALGGAYGLKLVVDWENSILAGATIGSTVPFLTMTSTTYEVTRVMDSGTVVSSATTVLVSDTVARSPYYNVDGSIASHGNTANTLISSATTTESGTTIVTETRVVTALKTEYGASEIDYSESRDNYKLVQGADGNWYFRNESISLQDSDLPFIGVAPVMADMLAQGSVRAFYQHLNTRHDKLEKGWSTWLNYTHTEDRLRKDYYNSTMIKQDIFQVGVDYSFVKTGDPYSLAPSISFGGAYSFTNAEATRREISTNFDVGYTRNDQSRLSATTHSLTGYASARWWRLYLDMLVEYSPDAKYDADIDSDVPFDVDGSVKGSRFTGSAELGVIITPRGLGQLEIYTQATGHKHDFDSISSIKENVELTNVDGYNAIYDPDSATGRRYRFSSPTTFRAEAGLRWGSHLQITDAIAVRPWGGLAYGRIMSSDYFIHVDQHSVRNDMRGNYYTFQGGLAALLRHNWQAYFTLGWTSGASSNNYTLSTGVSHRW